MEEIYKGYKIISDEREISNFYTYNLLDEVPYENQYILIDCKNGNYDKYIYQDGDFKKLRAYNIRNEISGKIRARNTYQSIAIDLLNDDSIPVKVLTGVFGSAKTFFMVNMALEKIEQGIYDKLIFVRNGLSPKGVPDIGHLPGTAEEKTIRWALPIADAIGGQELLEEFINSGKIEVQPMNFIRGRDFKHSIIFCDEIDNLTKTLFQLLLGRVGEGSTLYIAGDYRQCDLSKNFSEGLTLLCNKLRGNRLFGVVDMPVTERSTVANLSNLLDE